MTATGALAIMVLRYLVPVSLAVGALIGLIVYMLGVADFVDGALIGVLCAAPVYMIGSTMRQGNGERPTDRPWAGDADGDDG
jgi:hypothetical protein